MTSPDFAALLNRTMGLDPASLGPSAIATAVQARQLACQLPDAHGYWERLQASAAELQALVEALVVPETWFLRERDALSALAHAAREHASGPRAGDEWRVLSMACATGEEAYSIAIALFEAGMPADAFRIDGADISLHALAQAQRACYGSNAFRGTDPAFRERYFDATEAGWQLHEPVRRQVRFLQGNLFDDGFLPEPERYDVVFCRNVLIYFDRAAQDRAIQALARRLAAHGLLFLGAAEVGLLAGHGFGRVPGWPGGACRRAGPDPCPPPPGHAARRPAPRPVSAVATPAPAPPPPVTASLDTAEQFANQGRMAEAAGVCERWVAESGPSARALHLQGLIHGAGGDADAAIESHRKALYLDPDHVPSLQHLSALLDAQGDAAAARVLRQRMHRLQHRLQQQRQGA
jgi:chemotaxis protein methyltransferase WspC